MGQEEKKQEDRCSSFIHQHQYNKRWDWKT
jgi:hypothetical protein